MTPTFPKRRVIAKRCPYCPQQLVHDEDGTREVGGIVESVELHNGWVQRTMFGTRVGTYPDVPPADVGLDGAPATLEAFPDLDRWVAQPCGHQLSPEQARDLLDSAEVQ